MHCIFGLSTYLSDVASVLPHETMIELIVPWLRISV